MATLFRSHEDIGVRRMLPLSAGSGVVVPGEDICSAAAEHVKGSGLSTKTEAFVASVLGVRHQTNRLLSVAPLRGCVYSPETTDVVVGRVSRVCVGRWVVDIGAGRHATLRIDNVNLPGLLRVRSSADEANMRAWFAEGEVLSAEVRCDRGGPALITRSSQFGKLSHGLLVTVPPQLVRGATVQFVPLPVHAAHAILGRNGWCWVGPPRPPAEALETVVDRAPQDMPAETARGIVRVAQALEALARRASPISAQTLAGFLGDAPRSKQC